MECIKKLADFQDRFFKVVKEKSTTLLRGNAQKELESGEDFPVSLKADFTPLISEINDLNETKILIEGIMGELQSDFKDLLRSSNYKEFIDNFGKLVNIDQLRKLPDVLRGIIHMEVGLTLSFVAAIENFKELQTKDYEDSLKQYFFLRMAIRRYPGI